MGLELSPISAFRGMSKPEGALNPILRAPTLPRAKDTFLPVVVGQAGQHSS